MFSAFRIKARAETSKLDNWGTGWYYKDKVITAAHVIEGCTIYFAEFGKEWYELELIKTDAEADVSVLKFKNKTLVYSPINLKEGKIKEGESIHSFMGVNGQPLVHNFGKFVNKKSDLGSYLSIVHIPAASGASGSAILTDSNKVVGMLIQGYVLPYWQANKEDLKDWCKLFRLKEIKSKEDVKNYWQIVPIRIINEVIKGK